MAKTIEESFMELSTIIEELESNKLTLDEAFLKYEKGIKLLASCNKMLDKVEKQIIVLKEKSEE